MSHDDSYLGAWAAFGPDWAGCGPFGESARHKRGPRNRRARGRRGGGRRQFFESGEVKFVILRLIKEKPRHGYEVLKALEEEVGGWYTASPGTVYPTLQLLEDQGYIRVVETEGKKVYYITAEGEAFLAEHRDVLEDIVARIHEAVEDLTGGIMGDLNDAFNSMAGKAYRQARREGPGEDRMRRILEVLRRAGSEIDDILRT